MTECKLSSQDFPNICRICLQGADDLNFIELNNIHLYKLLTNIEIKKEDEFPKSVCKICKNLLDNINTFIDKCKNNEARLKEICLQENVKNQIQDLDSSNFEQPICLQENVKIQLKDSDCSNFEQNEEVQIKVEEVQIKVEEDDVSKLKPLKSGVNNGGMSTIVTKLDKCSICGECIIRDAGEHYRRSPKCKPNDFQCPVCEKLFYPTRRLLIHLKSHTKFSVSPERSKEFTSAKNLRRRAPRHTLANAGVKKFICNICEKGFSGKRLLDEHMNIHTGKTPYLCAYCGKGFKRFADHTAHIYHNHNENIENIPKHKRKYTEKRVHLKLECKDCGKVFASRYGYDNHQLIHKGVKKFLCDICGRKFRTNSVLQMHIRSHTGEKPFECKECGKVFGEKTLLTVHMRVHMLDITTDHSLNCPRCDKKYYTKHGLNSHILSHIKDKPQECPFCKQIHQVSALDNHILQHQRRKLHRCDVCYKLFMSSSHLNAHLRTHSGEKPYRCFVCGKQFAQPQTLKVHMRQHTGETPYVCLVCEKGFHDGSNLKRHFNRHHGSANRVKNINKRDKRNK